MSAEVGEPGAGPAPRLLYILTSFNNGGAEWGAVELLRGGAFAGFDVSVAALVRGAGAQVDTLKALGHRVDVLVEASRPGALALAVSAWRLRRLLRKLRPEIIVLSLPHANLLGRLLRPSRPRPLVMSFEHNSHLARPLYELGYRLTSGRVDWALADCRATADAAVARLYRRAPPRLDVAPLIAFSAERTADPVLRPPPGERLRLVSAARLAAPKNQAHLISLVAALLRRGIDAELTLFGEGPLRAELEALVASSGLSGRVAIPGHTPRWWRTPANLFVLTSRHEGLCIAALEAMAAGLPVAAPAVGGLSDYGPAAKVLVLDLEDVEEDADRLAALLRDPARLSTMVEAGRETIARRYAADLVQTIYAGISARLLLVAEARRA